MVFGTSDDSFDNVTWPTILFLFVTLFITGLRGSIRVFGDSHHQFLGKYGDRCYLGLRSNL